MFSNRTRNIMTLCDVSMRDGIQSLKSPTGKPILSPQNKYFMIKGLAQNGFDNVEIGSIVSKSIVEMSTTKDLIKMSKSINTNKMVLVPNYKYFNELLEVDSVNTVSLITSCSESFTIKNTKMTIEKSQNEIQNIIERIKHYNKFNEQKLNARIYISCCFGCPIENGFSKIYINRIMNIFAKFSGYNCVKEIVICDTNGSFDNYLFEDYLCYFANFADRNKLSFHVHKSNPTLQWACEIVGKTLYRTVSLDCSMGNMGGCSSLDNMPPNLPTTLMSRAYNMVSGENKYNVENLEELDKIFTINLL